MTERVRTIDPAEAEFPELFVGEILSPWENLKSCYRPNNLKIFLLFSLILVEKLLMFWTKSNS